MIYQVYWMNKEDHAERHHGFVIADSRDDAYWTATKALQAGYVVTHVYEASWNMVTPQSVCLNFKEPDYTLFG